MAYRAQVVVVPCDSYDGEKVFQTIKKGVDALGGISRFVRPEQKILVKPNFLLAAEDNKHITTNSAVIKGMLRLLSEEGCSSVKLGDSPGHGSCKAAAAKLGLEPDNMYGAEVADMSEEQTVKFPEGIECKEFHFAKEIVEADAIINLCKMKTHMLERITGAMKNVYGFICGYRKAAGHVKFPNDSIFARMLCDIHRCRGPVLNVMDGIVAMEGNGPAGGDPVDMHLMLFSADPVALDTTFCWLVNLDPDLVPTCSQGHEMGVGTDVEEEIELLLCETPDSEARTVTRAELFEKYGKPDFDVSRNRPPKSALSSFSRFMTRISRRPKIDAKKCIHCGVCVSHCPVPGKAVNFTKGPGTVPEYDYKKCIRCYCCQEMCPQHAIRAKGILF